MPIYAIVDGDHVNSFPYLLIEAADLKEALKKLHVHAETKESFLAFHARIFGHDHFQELVEDDVAPSLETKEERLKEMKNYFHVRGPVQMM